MILNENEKLKEREMTKRRWRRNNPIAWRESGYGGANGVNLSNAFITTNRRWFWPDGIYTLYPINVGRVNWSSQHLDAHIILFQFRIRNVHQFGDLVWLAMRVVYDRFRWRWHGGGECLRVYKTSHVEIEFEKQRRMVQEWVIATFSSLYFALSPTPTPLLVLRALQSDTLFFN